MKLFIKTKENRVSGALIDLKPEHLLFLSNDFLTKILPKIKEKHPEFNILGKKASGLLLQYLRELQEEQLEFSCNVYITYNKSGRKIYYINGGEGYKFHFLFHKKVPTALEKIDNDRDRYLRNENKPNMILKTQYESDKTYVEAWIKKDL